MPVDKCYTKKNKNGGNYTTCVDGKGKQLREKDKPKKKKLVLKEPAKAAPKKKKLVLKEPAKAAPKKKKLVLKEPAKAAPKKKVAAKYLNPDAGMNTRDPYYIPAFGTRRQNTTTAPLQNVSASTSALSASAVGTGNMDIKRMLRAGLKGSKDVKELSNMMRKKEKKYGFFGNDFDENNFLKAEFKKDSRYDDFERAYGEQEGNDLYDALFQPAMEKYRDLPNSRVTSDKLPAKEIIDRMYKEARNHGMFLTYRNSRMGGSFYR
jgi:hypothetical protein